LGSYTAILRRRWPYLVTIIPAVTLLATFLAFALPPKFRSSATILLEPSSIPPELVKTTVVSYADQQIELVQRTVMTVDRLEAVVRKVDPYPERSDLQPRDKALAIINDTTLEKVDPVTLKPMLVSSAFSVHYTNADPRRAAAVAAEIAQLFLTHNRETRVAAAKQAYEFLEARGKDLETQIRAMEQKLAEFKRQYGDALPEAQGRNEASLDRSQRDVDALDAQVRLAEAQESMLKLQLAQISPTLAASGTDAYTQLGTLRADLAAAQQKYTPEHPDVKRLTRAIQALVASANLGNTSNVRPDNPDYLRVSSELSASQRNLAALRSAALRARSQSADYERRLTMAPNVERDYIQLSRNHEVARLQFQDIQNKLGEAQVAQSLESQSRGERFTMIREPFAAAAPYSPNRIGLILLGLVLGGGLGMGLATFKESSDPTVRSANDVRLLGDLAVIGAIPRLLTRADRRRRNVVWGSIASAYGVALIVVAITVVGALRT
jgi:polysaccharide chain length determinant protein (PEP-CTERM system associated)